MRKPASDGERSKLTQAPIGALPPALEQDIPGKLHNNRLLPDHRGASGFTLIELMVAMAILAIISAIALPLYTNYSQRSYRSEAQADLLNCAQGMERLAAQSFSYENGAVGPADAGVVAPAICRTRSTDQGRYNITVTGDDSSFTLTAAPIGVMAGDGVMTINEAGDRTWDQNNSGGAPDANENNWVEE